MGGSDSMRQGFCLSRPEMASKVVSVIGDSCECHSGLDATRNGVFRNVPGVKVVLDNTVTGMTGAQPAPTSYANLAGVPNKFRLKEAIKAEKCEVVAVNAYDLAGVENALSKALDDAEKGLYTTAPECASIYTCRAGCFTQYPDSNSQDFADCWRLCYLHGTPAGKITYNNMNSCWINNCSDVSPHKTLRMSLRHRILESKSRQKQSRLSVRSRSSP